MLDMKSGTWKVFCHQLFSTATDILHFENCFGIKPSNFSDMSMLVTTEQLAKYNNDLEGVALYFNGIHKYKWNNKIQDAVFVKTLS
jgi:hypothetical protein